MEYEQQFSKLIYEYLLNRLKFGYYLYGDSLPTIDVFCREFQVSDHTIVAALQRLRTEGFIDMKNGRMTKVTYKQTEQEQQNFIIDYFSRRWTAYADLYKATELIYIPLIVKGLRRMNEQELEYICQLLEHAGAEDIIQFYCYTLQKMENPLLLNLFWETSMFLGFLFVKQGSHPFYFDTEFNRQGLETLLSLIKKRAWELVRNELTESQQNEINKILKSLEPHIQKVPKESQISFVWRIYRDRPQVCYNLASRILYEIYLGEYSDVKFLPSYEKMAAKYNVSISTIRRTVSMLNQIGAVQSINGKGTCVFHFGERCNQPDYTSIIVRRNLTCFVQAFELLSDTCEEISYQFFRSLSSEKRLELLFKFEENQRLGCYELSIWMYLQYVSEYSHIQAIGRIYGTFYDLFIWGYPLKASIETTPKTDRRGAVFTSEMIRNLKENDIEQCVASIRRYMQKQLPDGKNYLEQNGIGTEGLKLSPSIRMLVIDKF